MPVEVIECEQGTPEWFAARLGIPTASEFACVIAQGKGGGESVGRRTYMYKLAGEIITGEIAEAYTNPDMERGKAMEAEIRAAYEFENDLTVQCVGFLKNGRKGASPDGLIGNDGLVEFKSCSPHILIQRMKLDNFPPEHMAQCQGQLLVSEREWTDCVLYWPKMPRYVKRTYRDEAYIAKINAAIRQFNDDLDELVAWLRQRQAA
ncbi:MAG: exonuclease [Rhizobiales bacterium]|nr:exonuclease [Hyphomicrobiales bacterium]